MTPDRSQTSRRKLGIALGAGAARGLCHIGVLRALGERGVEPRIVCGTSMGALVGAAYAAGHLASLEDWVRTLDLGDIVRLLDVHLTTAGGFAEAGKLIEHLRETVGDLMIEELPRTFAAVATDLATGRELWLREGSLWDAVRASIAVPGILTPKLHAGRWLVDGALVNPVPVSVCRALDADVVLAVNLTGGLTGRHLSSETLAWAGDEAATGPPGGGHGAPVNDPEGDPEDDPGGDPEREEERAPEEEPGLMARVKETLSREDWASELFRRGRTSPTVFEVLGTALDIMEDRITRSRMAGDPPDLVFNPKVLGIELFEFQRAEEAIEAGRRAVERERDRLDELLGPGERT